MKVAAHPLVVAVAFGLLSPAALAEEKKEPAVERCVGCDCGAMTTYECSDLSDAPSPDEVARVQAEWHEVRGLV